MKNSIVFLMFLCAFLGGSYAAENRPVSHSDKEIATAATSVSINIDNAISCNGNSNGQLTATPSGGVAPYTYLWSNGATTATISGLVAGTYSVTVTDNLGATSSNSVNLTQPDALFTLLSAASNVSCFGGTDGEATVAGYGGTAPYTFLWSNGVTTSTNSGLSAGIYSVSITDANGCSSSTAVLITEPAVLTTGIAIDNNVSCNGLSDGQASSTPTGGTSPYTYLWDNGVSTSINANLAIGTYGVTVTDDNGCITSNSVVITEPDVLTASTSLNNNVSCNGNADGSATVTPVGGTTPYTYAWDNGETTATATSLNAGTHTVNITDAKGCTTSSSVVVTEPVTLTGSTQVDANVSCNGGSDASATVNVTGGTAPFTYLWDNGATTATASALAAGTYNVTVTDANGCNFTTAATVTEPTSLIASAALDANVSCNGGSDGGATVTGTGGTSPYAYAWSNGATTASISGVTAGTYTVAINDANGCVAVASVSITEPTALVASTTLDANISCNGLSDGGATANATGGTAPYTYAWDNGATTASITGVVAGTYTVTVTDANGCTATSSITITEPTVLTASTSVDANVSCNGLSDGGATVSATGGTAPYTYAWDNGATTASISGVVAGTYAVTITDANGCTATSSVTITEPAVLIASTAVDANISCNGGADGGATASATGGTAPYTHAWDNGATTASISGVVAGTYVVTVTDANGCTATSSVTITEPTALSATAIVDANISCNGASDGGASVTAAGGTAPYAYAWSNGATTASISGVVAGSYTVAINDANGCIAVAMVTITEPAVLNAATVVDANVSCNGLSDGGATASATGGTAPYTYAWDNGATTASISGVVAGTYVVTITDANGCTSTSSVTVTEPSVLISSAVVDANVSCNGGTDAGGTASATGGTAPYTYAWDNGATTASITGVAAGTYTVTVTDANGCTSTSTITITEPTVLTASTVVDANISCNGLSDGGATASATGGTAPYTYAWDNGATTASISGVVAGSYSVTATDANGCSATSTITITEPAVLVSTAIVDANVSCNGGTDGGATASATGGTAPYTYAWDNGATTASITGVIAGTYTATVTDANGCTSNTSVTITEPTALTASSVIDVNVSCNGLADGGATASATGGTAPYTYAWDNGATTASISGVVAGTYTATITDANGCTATTAVTITEPTVLVASTNIDASVSCNGLSDGGATASATGGTAPYTYVWDNGATTASITGVMAGTYTVTVTDANGCTATQTAVISEPAVLVAGAAIDNNVSCNGGTDGSLTVNVTGGTAPFTYAWDNGVTTATNAGLTIGTYTVVVTDANGCTANATATITEPTVLTSSALVDNNLTCNAGTDGGATVFPAGGTAPYTYLWDNNETTASATALTAGTHSVVVTDANGCSSTSSVTLTEPTAIVVSTTVIIDATCPNAADGEASASATGGVGPYTYLWSTGATTASVTGLTVGNHTVTVTDASGCTSTATVTINAIDPYDNASFAYTTNTFCVNAGNVSPTITGLPGGMFSSTTGLEINTISGTIDLNLSTPGTYDVTYQTVGSCPNTSTVTVTVNAIDDASFAYNLPLFCLGGTNPLPTITGTTGGTFSSTAGLSIDALTGEVDLQNSLEGQYTITYTTSGMCANTATYLMALVAPDTATFSYAQANYCQYDANPTPTLTGTVGGTFTCGSSDLVIDPVTGEVDIAASVPGNYLITYTTTGVCAASETVSFVITNIDTSVGVNGLTLTSNQNNASYQWIDCLNGGVEIANEVNQSLTVTENGEYAVVVTVNGCVDTSDCIVINTVNLEELDLAAAFKVYPNPTNGMFKVDFSRTQESLNFRLYDLAGNLIQEKQVEGVSEVDFTLDYPKGVYLLEVVDAYNNKATVRIVKQ